MLLVLNTIVEWFETRNATGFYSRLALESELKSISYRVRKSKTNKRTESGTEKRVQGNKQELRMKFKTKQQQTKFCK